MRILVIAAHPDDETLGAGGTLLRHRSEGDDLFWCLVTKAWEPRWTREMCKRKLAEVRAVSEAYPFAQVYRLGFLTTTLGVLAPLIVTLGNVLRDCLPDVVYTVGPHDVHSDHAAVFEALMIASKPAAAPGCTRRILTMEIPSSTEAGTWRRRFAPTVFVDISEYLSEKRRILEMYETEEQPFPLARSSAQVGALAHWRGAGIGVVAAEAFELIRETR